MLSSSVSAAVAVSGVFCCEDLLAAVVGRLNPDELLDIVTRLLTFVHFGALGIEDCELVSGTGGRLKSELDRPGSVSMELLLLAFRRMAWCRAFL